MSVGLVAVQLHYGLYVVGHLSKLVFYFMFKVVSLLVVLSSVRLACNVPAVAAGRHKNSRRLLLPKDNQKI